MAYSSTPASTMTSGSMASTPRPASSANSSESLDIYYIPTSKLQNISFENTTESFKTRK